MSEVKAIIALVDKVYIHPNSDKLGISEVLGHTIVSSKLENGNFRYSEGDLVVYIPENAILPEFLLKEGYWDDESGKGILSGSKGNRIKNRKIADVVSAGLIFPVKFESSLHAYDWCVAGKAVCEPLAMTDTDNDKNKMVGRDVTEALGIIEYVPQN